MCRVLMKVTRRMTQILVLLHNSDGTAQWHWPGHAAAEILGFYDIQGSIRDSFKRERVVLRQPSPEWDQAGQRRIKSGTRAQSATERMNAYATFPKFPARMMASNMSIALSWLKSAYGFQFGPLGMALKTSANTRAS